MSHERETKTPGPIGGAAMAAAGLVGAGAPAGPVPTAEIRLQVLPGNQLQVLIQGVAEEGAVLLCLKAAETLAQQVFDRNAGKVDKGPSIVVPGGPMPPLRAFPGGRG